MDSKKNTGSLISRTVKYFHPNRNRTLVLLGLLWLSSLFLLITKTLRRSPIFAITSIMTSIFFSCLAWRLIRRRIGKSPANRLEDSNEFDTEYLKNLRGLPTIFTFKDLETATAGFSKEIGKGGFGRVWEGILGDGTLVAVKCLENRAGQGQKEFCAEIATISSVNHSNLVTLRGVCAEGQHRILVYEFMANGSLDRWLFSSDKHLDWKTRYSIALNTARGLAYLHEDSKLCILHLDIKPQNILLDENFKTKLSDFGLAKCLNRDLESRVVTQVRGTAGYIAPEWFFEQGITSKCDVFSFGMVLLEIVSGRRNVDNTQDSEHWFFPSIAFSKALQEKMEDLIDGGLELKTPQEMEEAYRLIKTALWCIQSNSALRPSMGTVVRILEGGLEIMDPPLDCALPFAPFVPSIAQADGLEMFREAASASILEIHEVQLASETPPV